MSKTLPGALFALLVSFLGPCAMAQSKLPNGFTESPQCVVKADHWEQIPGTSSYRLKHDIKQGYDFSHSAHTILVWYYGGAEAMRGVSGWTARRLASCFQDARVDGCELAIPADKKIHRALDNFSEGKASKGERKRLDKLFSQKPPPGLITFAAEELGACFGNEPAQPSLEEIHWVEITPSEADCQEFGKHRDLNFPNVSYLRRERFLDPWWKSFEAQLKAGPVCDRPIWVPRQVRDNFAESTREAIRFANRPVEERIAGLNGCEIAYGIVKMGMTQAGGVSRVPDEGRIWAAQYEDSVIDKAVCPSMSQSLSNWIQAQPLTQFEPAPNPFIAFRDNGPAADSRGGWREHLYRVLSHYDQGGTTYFELTGDDCAGYVQWLQRDRFGTAGDTAENYIIHLAQHRLRNSGSTLCAVVPDHVYAPYTWKRDITARKIAEFERKDAERKEAWKRFEETVTELQRWKPEYRPAPGEPRCYRTGEKTETCFYN